MSANFKNPGTQQPIEPTEIGPPDYEIMAWKIEETIELLLDQAISIGEEHSQAAMLGGQLPAPRAHQATTQYHAIEAIRYLQAKLADVNQKLGNLEDLYENVCLELGGENV